jgi:deazaflavin-dependent oxidoreductase (nitroreductase family)
LYRRRVGVAEDLGYAIPVRANALQRSVRGIASSRPGAWTLARTLPSFDRIVSRLTRGRTTLSERLAGLPVLVVTTTGRRSGRPRPAQLIGIPVGDTVALVGTNFGQISTPAWVLNLEAEPRATVTARGVTLDVVAREATDGERAATLARAGEVYVGYSTYLTRISGRRVRVFVLESPAQQG